MNLIINGITFAKYKIENGILFLQVTEKINRLESVEFSERFLSEWIEKIEKQIFNEVKRFEFEEEVKYKSLWGWDFD